MERRNDSGRLCQLTLHLPVRRLSWRRGWHPFFLARNLVHRIWRSEGVVFDVGGAIHGGCPNQSVSSQSGQCALTRWNKRPASRLWSAIAFLHGVCSKRWMKICRQPSPCSSTLRILTWPAPTTDDLAFMRFLKPNSTMNTLNSSVAQHHAPWTKRNIETKGWCLAREFVCSFALIGKDTRVHP